MKVRRKKEANKGRKRNKKKAKQLKEEIYRNALTKKQSEKYKMKGTKKNEVKY